MSSAMSVWNATWATWASGMCAWHVVVLVARPSSEGSAVRHRREVDWAVALAKGAVTGEGDSRD